MTCDRRGKIERARQLSRDAQRIAGRRRTVFANAQVERIGGDVILGENAETPLMPVASGATSAGCAVGARSGDRIPRQADARVRRQVEFEQLDGDRRSRGRIVGAKHRSSVPAPI